jgi:hypothetical protein
MSKIDIDNEDLEDGEIEEDDDDSCVIVDEPLKKPASVPKADISVKTKSSVSQKTDSYKSKKPVKNDNKFLSSAHRHHSPQPKKKRPAVVEGMFVVKFTYFHLFIKINLIYKQMTFRQS